MAMTDTISEFVNSSYGVVLYSAGLGVLTAYPQGTGYYRTYYGTNSRSVVANSLRTAIADAGMEVLEAGRTAPPIPPGSQYYAPNNYIARLGNAATVDAANSVSAQYGRFVSNPQMDLTSIPGCPQNIYTYANGQTFRPDLSYRTWSPWSGGTEHFDSVKAVNQLRGSAKNIGEVAQYGRAISEVNAASSGMRLLGTSLRALGVAGVAYDIYSTGNAIGADLSRNDTVGAGREIARFGGRLGGMAYGASLGAYGFAAGPFVGAATTTIGGIAGTIAGEQGVSWIYNSIFGAPSSGLPGRYTSSWSAPSQVTATFNGDQAVSGAATVNGDLIGSVATMIDGNLSLFNSLTINGNFVGGGSVNVNGDLFLGNQLAVNGGITPGGTLNVNGNIYGQSGISAWPAPDVPPPPWPGDPVPVTAPANFPTTTGPTELPAINVGPNDPPPDDPGPPIVLDLTGNGVNITQLTSSNKFFDMTGDGLQNQTAWAGVGNGVLFYDPKGTGQLTQANQIVFTMWDPSASSDMQALLDVFDTNHDGSLDAGDTNFGKFFVMETNADGTYTAQSLTDLHITSIDLHANATNIALPDGSSIDGETTYTMSGGTTRTVATVTFRDCVCPGVRSHHHRQHHLIGGIVDGNRDRLRSVLELQD